MGAVLPFGVPSLRREKEDLVRSVFFYGPSGSGKTMLARGIAHACGARWFELSPSRLFKKNRDGEMFFEDAKRMQHFIHVVFDVAKFLRPSVIYINDVDQLFPENPGV